MIGHCYEVLKASCFHSVIQRPLQWSLWDLEALSPLSSALAVLGTLQHQGFWASKSHRDLGVSLKLLYSKQEVAKKLRAVIVNRSHANQMYCLLCLPHISLSLAILVLDSMLLRQAL